MLDVHQEVHTKDVAEAINNLSGALLAGKKLTRVSIQDDSGAIHIICPDLIARVQSVTLYNTTPQREGAQVIYLNGDRFCLVLTTVELSRRLGIESAEL